MECRQILSGSSSNNNSVYIYVDHVIISKFQHMQIRLNHTCREEFKVRGRKMTQLQHIMAYLYN